MKYKLILAVLITLVASNSMVWAVWHTSDDFLDNKKFSDKRIEEQRKECDKVCCLLENGFNKGRFSKDDRASLEVIFYIGSDKDLEEKLFEILSQNTFGPEKNKDYITANITGSIQKDLRVGIGIKAISAFDVLTLGSLDFKLQKNNFDAMVEEYNNLMSLLKL